MKKKDNEYIENIVENTDESIIVYPHTYLSSSRKISVPNILAMFIFFVITLISMNLLFFHFFPTNLVMKIGNIEVTKEQYDYIYNNFFMENMNEILDSQEMTDDEKLEAFNSNPYYSRKYIEYIEENILLGLKAKEMNLSINSNTYYSEQELYGNLYEYFILAKLLKTKVSLSDTHLSSMDKKNIYYNNIEEYIDYSKSTITYQTYLTDQKFNKISNSESEVITESFKDFSFNNLVYNTPTEDSYRDLQNGYYKYFDVISTNIIYYDYDTAKEDIQTVYTEFKTEDILYVYIEEMRNKYGVIIYV